MHRSELNLAQQRAVDGIETGRLMAFTFEFWNDFKIGAVCAKYDVVKEDNNRRYLVHKIKVPSDPFDY
jgi:hypothetical protein